MTGVAPQQSYGHEVNGASPTQTHDMRVNLKAATHFGGSQSCITTTLAWLFGPVADPGVKNFTQQLDAWVLVWAGLDAIDKRATRRTWAIALGKVLWGSRFNRPKGPIEATIAALLHLGWKPSAPDQWEVDDETRVRLDGKVITRFQVTARAQEDAQKSLAKGIGAPVQ